MNEEELENAIHTLEEMLKHLKHKNRGQSMETPDSQNEIDISIEDTYRTTFLLHPEQKQWASTYIDAGAVKSLERFGLISMEYARQNESTFKEFAVEHNNKILQQEFLSDINTDSEEEDMSSDSTTIGVETSQTKSESKESTTEGDDSMESTEPDDDSTEQESAMDDKSVDELLEEEFGDGFDT